MKEGGNYGILSGFRDVGWWRGVLLCLAVGDYRVNKGREVRRLKWNTSN
jgi:hypothetical protein